MCCFLRPSVSYLLITVSIDSGQTLSFTRIGV
jgi:hypothetical protein